MKGKKKKMVILKEQRHWNVESLWGIATLKRSRFCCVITALMTPPQSCCLRKVYDCTGVLTADTPFFIQFITGGSCWLPGEAVGVSAAGFPKQGDPVYIHDLPLNGWRDAPSVENRPNILKAASSLNNASVPSDKNNRGTFYASEICQQKKTYLFKLASGKISQRLDAQPVKQFSRLPTHRPYSIVHQEK